MRESRKRGKENRGYQKINKHGDWIVCVCGCVDGRGVRGCCVPTYLVTRGQRQGEIHFYIATFPPRIIAPYYRSYIKSCFILILI